MVFQEALPPYLLQRNQLAGLRQDKSVLLAGPRQKHLQTGVSIWCLTDQEINAVAHQPGSRRGGSTRSLLPG